MTHHQKFYMFSLVQYYIKFYVLYQIFSINFLLTLPPSNEEKLTNFFKENSFKLSPNVLKSPNLTHAISQFLANIPVPISPKVPNIAEFAEIAEFS
jgi:hypothetical protein